MLIYQKTSLITKVSDIINKIVINNEQIINYNILELFFYYFFNI